MLPLLPSRLHFIILNANGPQDRLQLCTDLRLARSTEQHVRTKKANPGRGWPPNPDVGERLTLLGEMSFYLVLSLFEGFFRLAIDTEFYFLFLFLG